jgi:SAM-dependent methyltransferase
MAADMPEAFTRYLEVKKPLDDRSLNRHVYGTLARHLAKFKSQRPLRVLEVGAGIGTMLGRLLEWGLFRSADYTAVDANPAFTASSQKYLRKWAEVWDYQFQKDGESAFQLQRQGSITRVNLVTASLQDFIQQTTEKAWDLLIAHAFLDLVNLDQMLLPLVRLVEPGGLLYFTINYDGETIFEPAGETELDVTIKRLYHASMDNRLVNGMPSGDSRTGRHLISHLRASRLPILAAGSSDWVSFSGPDGYSEDEKFFLDYILSTIEKNLQGQPEIETQLLNQWITQRRAQVTDGSLVYIAHQLDLLAEVPALG